MAGRIPQQFIDDLVARVDIVDLIDSFVPLRKAGRDHMARCPFHEEKTPSFTVSRDKQFYHCFGCGAHGTAIGFMMEYNRLDFVDAVHELAARAGVEVPREARPEAQERRGPDLYALLERTAAFFRRQFKEHPRGREAVEYLKGRGVSGATAAEFGLGFAPPAWDALGKAIGGDREAVEGLVMAGLSIEKDGGGHYDRFRDRVMFPIRDQRGRVIAFGGRVLGAETPKYLNSPETPLFHKGRELYGLFEARRSVRRLERLLVVEGYMDVIMLAQHGIRYAVATLGTATTPEHLERMFRLAPEVVFCFDGDRAGRAAAWRALEHALPLMREGRQARFMFLPEGEDPDTLIRKENQAQFEKRIVSAVTLSSFFYDRMTDGADIASIDGRARLVELVRPYLAKLPEGVFRHMMVERLGEIARVEGRTLEGILGWARAAQKGGRTATGRTPGQPGPSLVRKAVCLLMHNPALAGLVEAPRQFERLDVPGVPLLVEMVELLQRQPHLNTGALLEHWREHEYGGYLARLAQFEHLIEAGDMEREFCDAWQRLHRQYLKQQIEDLNKKPRKEWSSEEKEELKQLLERMSSVV